MSCTLQTYDACYGTIQCDGTPIQYNDAVQYDGICCGHNLGDAMLNEFEWVSATADSDRS